jgi:hypothetical protein
MISVLTKSFTHYVNSWYCSIWCTFYAYWWACLRLLSYAGFLNSLSLQFVRLSVLKEYICEGMNISLKAVICYKNRTHL